jgi:hypothetical protein
MLFVACALLSCHREPPLPPEVRLGLTYEEAIKRVPCEGCKSEEELRAAAEVWRSHLRYCMESWSVDDRRATFGRLIEDRAWPVRGGLLLETVSLGFTARYRIVVASQTANALKVYDLWSQTWLSELGDEKRPVVVSERQLDQLANVDEAGGHVCMFLSAVRSDGRIVQVVGFGGGGPSLLESIEGRLSELGREVVAYDEYKAFKVNNR